MATFPRYTWSPSAGRYSSRSTGQFIGAQAVRRALDAALETEQQAARVLAERLRAGAITQREWTLAMREMIKATHLYSVAAAKGGWARLTADDLRQIERAIARQYAFLDRFAEDITNGLPLDGRYFDRVIQYAEAGRALYLQAETEVRIAAGDREYRNRLHPADHCEQCPALTGRALGGTGTALSFGAQDDGWAVIGSLPPIGSRECRSHDRCSYEYRGAA